MKDRSRKALVLAAVVAVLLAIDAALYWRVRQPRVINPEDRSDGQDVVTTLPARPYAAALSRYVGPRGLVDYRALKEDPGDLNGFLRTVARLDPKTYEGWDDRRKIAFWTNVYNALTLRVIVDHYPIRPTGLRRQAFPPESIRQIPGVWTKLRFVVMGGEVTLDEVEHKRLRAEFKEPRIHMALVCAAMSCPPLRPEPYAGATLDEQLDDQARQFLARQDNFRIDREAGKVHLSSIFKWFGGDFVPTYAPKQGFGEHPDDRKAVLNFVAGYLPAADAEYLRSGAYSIEYVTYDWSLNRQRKPATTAGAEG